MLFNLLPGLREIRAPLISGYVWLTFFFLALHEDLPSAGSPGSVLNPLFEIGESLTTGGLIAVTGVAAYLVGSAMQELWKVLGRVLSPGRPFYGEAGTRTSASGRRDVKSAVRVRMQNVTGLLSQVAVAPGERGIADEPDPEEIERELPLIRTLLLGERPELVGELDRLQAEADLRVTVAFPLAFLAVYLAWKASHGWILLLLPALLLLVQGYQRQLDAGDLLAKALKIGKADAPSLEALTASAKAVLQRVELEAELRRRVDEEDGMAAFQLGNLQASWDDFDSAANSLRFAADKGVVRAYAELGFVYERSEEDEKAERAYRDGAQRRDEKAQLLLTALLQRLDRGEEARVAAGDGADEGSTEKAPEQGSEAETYRRRMREGDARARAKAALNLGLYHRRHEEEEKAVTVLREAAALNPDDPQILIQLGNSEIELGRFAGARDSLERALRLQRTQLGDSNHLDIAATLNTLGNVLDEIGEYRESREHLERALEIRESQLGRNHSEVADTLGDLAIVRERFDEVEVGREMNERALSIYRRYGDERSAARILSNLGESLQELGHFQNAKEAVEEALQIDERVRPSDDPLLARTKVTLGVVLGDLGEYERARTLIAEGIPQLEDDVGSQHHHADALLGLGRILVLAGRPDKGLEVLERALGIATASLGPGHPLVGSIEMEIGAARRALGDVPRALIAYEEALAILSRYPGRALRALCLRGLAETFADGGRELEGLELLRQVIQVQDELLRPDHPEKLRSLRLLAALLERTGQQEAAEDARARAAELEEGQ